MLPQLEAPTCDDSLIRQLWLSVYQFPMLTAADELDLFTLLDKKPATIEEIGAKLSLSFRAAEALASTLASLGLLARNQGAYHLTDVSRNYLVPSKPFYWGHMFRLVREVTISHETVLRALTKDTPADSADGKPLSEEWEAVDMRADRAIALTRGMHSHSFSSAVALARHADLSGVKSFLDVAGGSGCFCIALALRYPAMRLTLAELPAVCKVARSYITEYGMADRVNIVELDMFHGAFPAGHDAIFFSNIFHDWPEALRDHLMRKTFEALPSGGRILIYEMLLGDAQDGPVTAALFTASMVFCTEGKQFTAAELDKKLRSFGFEDVTVTPGYAGYSLVSAIRG